MRGGVVPSGRTRNAESCRCAHMAKWIHLPSAARDRCGCARAGQDALGTLGISLRERSNAPFFPSPLVPRQCVCNLWSARPAKPASGLGLSSQPMAL